VLTCNLSSGPTFAGPACGLSTSSSGRGAAAKAARPSPLLPALAEAIGVAVRVFEDGPPTPELPRRRFGKLDALRPQLLVRPLDIVAVEQDVGERADAARLLLGRKEHEQHVPVRRGHLNPAG